MTTPTDDELTLLRKKARRRLVGAVALVLFALIVLWNVLDAQPPAALTFGQQPIAIVGANAPVTQLSVSPLAPPVIAPAASAPVEREPLSAAAVAKPAAPAPVVQPLPKPVAVETAAPDHATQQLKPAVSEKHDKDGKTTAKGNDKPAADKTEAKHATKAPAKAERDPGKILDGLEPEHGEKNKAVEKTAGYLVQIGAFADLDKAEQLKTKLKAAGVKVMAETVETSKGKLMRLRAGPYSEKSAAEAAAAKVKAAGGSGAVVAR